MNRLRLKKNALNKKTAYKKRVFLLKHLLRAEFLERIVRAIRGFTVLYYKEKLYYNCFTSDFYISK